MALGWVLFIKILLLLLALCPASIPGGGGRRGNLEPLTLAHISRQEPWAVAAPPTGLW